MGMEILRELKWAQHAELVNFMLQAIEDNLLTSSLTAKEISLKISVLQVTEFQKQLARNGYENIQNCFAHCGFKHSGTGNIDLIKSCHVFYIFQANLEPQLTISENLLCFNNNHNQNVTEQMMEIMTYQPNDDDSETESEHIT